MAPKLKKNAFSNITVSDARTLFTTIYQQEESNRAKYLQLHRQLEGGKPYNQDELDKDGQGHRANHNFRDGEAQRNRAALPYWEMVNTQATRVAVKLYMTTPEKTRYEKAFAECFDEWVDDWSVDYIVTEEQSVREYIDFGKTFVRFQDDSPRYKPLKIEEVLFPARTPLSPKKWKIFYSKDTASFSELWELVLDEKTEKAAKERGWNLTMVKAVLSAAVERGEEETNMVEADMVNRRVGEWDDTRNSILNNDLTENFKNPEISLISVYRKESDGKISQRIFLESPFESSDTDELPESLDNFLFKQTAVAECFEEMVCPNYWEVANGMIGGVKGFAERNYNNIVMTNRLRCSMVDMSDISGALNFRRMNEQTDDEAVIENFGPINVVSKSLEPIKFHPDIASTLAVSQELERNQAENNAIYRDSSKQIADTETAKQAQLLAAIQSQVSRANAALYLAYRGELWTQCMKKLRKKGSKDTDAKKFVKRMKAMDVPEKVIYESEDSEMRVSASGSPSTASPAAREVLFQELLQLINRPGVNGRNILLDWFANKVGSRNIERYMPKDPENTAKGARGYAKIEEGTMTSGIPLPVDPMQDHSAHLTVNLETLGAIASQFAQSKQTEQGQVRAARFIAPHAEAHLRYLQQDDARPEEFKRLNAMYSQIKPILLQMINQYEQEKKGEQNNAV